jgi:glucose/arabinose dehydrogenase
MRANLYGNGMLCHVASTKKMIARTAIALIALSLTFAGCKKDKNNNNNNGSGSGTPNLRLVAENFTAPVGVVTAPDGLNRLFVIDQTGKVWIVNAEGTRLETPFIDISSKMVSLTPQYDERGLLGMAFHPKFTENGKFYLFYTAPPRAGGPTDSTGWNNLTRISEFRTDASGANTASASSERVILQADHPQMNHNGGTIAFGHDGYLYISIGDGGGSNDVGPGHVSDWYGTNKGGNAQNVEANLMGKILRIDVDNGSPYSIPPGNPFANTPNAKPEIYAFGFRNPYRFSFDMGGNKMLYVGDAGQKLWEEINVVVQGGNYGWNIKEGTACFDADSNLKIRPDCPSNDPQGRQLVAPAIQLKNTAHPEGGGLGTVVVGGNVYRGKELPAYQGRYIFGMFTQSSTQPSGKLYVANAAMNNYEELPLRDFPGNLGQYLRGFGQDMDGEIYITTTATAGVSGATGKVYKIILAQ